MPYSDYQFVGKKVYYLLDKSDSYVLKRCNLNGSKVETLGVFNKKKSQDFFNAHGFKGKSSEISYYKDHNYYTYKYTYKTKKLKLVEKI